MIRKILFFILALPTLSLAQAKSIHYSAIGDYLVDENGERTIIQGHPRMECHRKGNTLRGTFLFAEGATIWLQVPTVPPSDQPDWKVRISNPVCDILE